MRYNYKVNHDYFDKIDTERKAYFLGLIYADGTIVSASNRQKQLCIALQEEDSYLLEEICKDIKPFKEITISYPPNIAKHNWKKRAVFKVSSDLICQKLIDMGCIQRKSKLGMTFPSLDENLIHHFIRGFFDGDGCIYVREVENKYIRKTSYTIKNPFKRKLQKRVQFCSTSEQFLKDCINHINNKIQLKGSVHWRKVKRTLFVYKVSIEMQKDVENFKNYLYSDAKIFMIRKKNKFDMSISSLSLV